MTLELDQYKMPILQNVNDIPSVIGQETHPNGSLFCKQYNDLIDALKLGAGTGEVNALIITTESLYYLVDADNGDDDTAEQGRGDLPYLTIAKVFEDLKLYDIRHDITIELRGVFLENTFNFESLYVKTTRININLISGYGEYFSDTKGEIIVDKFILTVPTLATCNIEGVLFRLNSSLFLSNVRNVYFIGCDFLVNRSTILNPINSLDEQLGIELTFSMIVIIYSNINFYSCNIDKSDVSYNSWRYGMTMFSSNVYIKDTKYFSFIVEVSFSAFIKSIFSNIAILELSNAEQNCIVAELGSVITKDEYFDASFVITNGSIVLTDEITRSNMFINSGIYS